MLYMACSSAFFKSYALCEYDEYPVNQRPLEQPWQRLLLWGLWIARNRNGVTKEWPGFVEYYQISGNSLYIQRWYITKSLATFAPVFYGIGKSIGLSNEIYSRVNISSTIGLAPSPKVLAYKVTSLCFRTITKKFASPGSYNAASTGWPCGMIRRISLDRIYSYVIMKLISMEGGEQAQCSLQTRLAP